MIDWTKQTEEMTKTWLDAQKKVWESWLGTMQQFEKTQAADVWIKTVGTWEESVKNILKAQSDWTRLWADSFKSVEGMPKEATEWVQQGPEMVKHWSEAQQQLWDNWFALLKKVEPVQIQMSEDLSQESQKMFKAWQETSQKVFDAQKEWANRWTDWQAAEKVGAKK